MRSILDGIRLAFRAIARNPLRASLTVLGILIGVAAVVLVTGLGAGLRGSVGAAIQSLGSNAIIIFPNSTPTSGKRGAQGTGQRLTEEDGRAIMRESTSVAAIAPLLRSGVQLVYGDKNWNTSIYGTTLPYFQVRDWKVVKGTAWELHDEATKAKVIVLGSSVATKLFGTEDPIGRSIRVGRYPFRVLGVLDSKGEAPFSGDQDDCVIIPIGSYRSRVQHTPPGFAGILLASATSTETTSGAVKQMESILRQRHHIEEGRDEDFEIHSQKEFADMQEDILGMLSAMLIGVAAVSLLVGGIGVMNIMLVNVTERTREIGIRMAIGARAGDIRAQFLVEAVSLALLGGLAGAALGFAGTSFAAKMIGWTVPFDVRPLALALGVSGGIGVGFGFFPARRAAQLDPIDALRHE